MPKKPLTLREWAGVTAPRAFSRKSTAVLLIDFQEEYYNGELPIPDGEKAAAHAAQLLDWCRTNGIMIVHVRHEAPTAASPLFAPGGPSVEFHLPLQPEAGETVIRKNFPSSFHGTDLHDLLRDRGVSTLVLSGLMTHMCVESTARHAAHLGYRVVVAADACASRDLPDMAGGVVDHGLVHRTSLAVLADRFSDVLATAGIMRLPVE